MVIEHNVKGYDEFKNLVGELEQTEKPIFVLFSGGKDENGESWCPYCVTGEGIWFYNLLHWFIFLWILQLSR